jgi:hypothetical protein
MQIIKNNYVTIEKLTNHYTMKIIDYSVYKNFWDATINMLNIINKKFNNDKEYVIKFNCNNIELLPNLLYTKKNLLSYRHSLLFFLCIGEQLKNLEKDKYSIIGFNTTDFITINNDINRYNTKFLFLNPSLFYKLNNNNIIISDPNFKTCSFLSPELLHINKISNDTSVHKNSTIFALSYIIATLLNKNIKTIDLKNYKIVEFKKLLEPVSNTKLYFALLRCFHQDPEKRFYLYI